METDPKTLERHKRSSVKNAPKPRVSFQKAKSKNEDEIEAQRIRHELALGPDITYEEGDKYYH